MNDENTLTALIGLLAEALNAYTENKKLITARLRAEDAQNKWEKENDLHLPMNHTMSLAVAIS